MAEFRPFYTPEEADRDKPVRPFLSITQGVVDVLEGITAAEKAQAVPHVRIWQIDPATGKPVHGTGENGALPSAPLSTQLSTPPRFGQTLADQERFRERPPVSLERISIKTNAPKGFITYRQIEMSFIVHRPDVVFEELSDDRDTWSSLILPGSVHVLEYGWRASSGVKNGILNGLGHDDKSAKPPVVVPAIAQIRFTVVNYSFSIMPDNQIRVAIQAFEDSEFNMRQALLTSPAANEKGLYALAKEPPLDAYSKKGQEVVAKLQKQVIEDLQGKADKKTGRIKFSDLLNVVFAKVIVDAYAASGYEEPALILGDFNERVGKPAEKYAFKPTTNSPGKKWIGDFELPLKDVRELFAKLITKENQQITLQNFITPVLTIFRDPRTWDRKGGKKDDDGDDAHTIPEVFIRAVDNPATRKATFYIFDAQREFTKFTDDDFKKSPKEDATREQIRDILKDKGIPMISFGRGNSYVQDANFEVIQDDQIKSILIRRYLQPSRESLQDVSKKVKLEKIPDASKILYSSAIQGDVTMLGNFAFDLFGLVWLDFGVSVWSGPFNVREREDIIERGSFVTRVSFISEGSDPLGTQGRKKAIDAINRNEKKIAEAKKGRRS